MPNFKNRTLFHGENIDILRGMDGATVDLIATDPPFNKGRDFHATPDSVASGAKFQDRWDWDRDTEGAWHDQIQDESPAVWGVIEFAKAAYGDDMAAFLCFMGVRLMEMHRILKPTGSLYLHCDPTASHYLKALLDAIFGRKQFRNEIVWRKYSGRKNNARRKFSTQHESLLFYGKSPRAAFNGVIIPHSEKEIKKKYTHGDDDGRRYRLAWGRTYQLTGVNRRIYLDESPGRAVGNLWIEDGLQLNTSSSEKVGYPTQKPIALYERIIAASSNPGDMVLDPFCGCATTPIAAERLGRQWVGIDLWDGADEMIKRRMAAIGLASPETKSTLTTVADIHYETDPPVRTDGGLAAAPHLAAKYQRHRPQAEWQKMSRSDMSDALASAQRSGTAGDLVVCAGCGRSLEARFFHLDHRLPRSEGGEHFITNRVLLCAPCNQTKSDSLTLTGLWRRNRADKWMQNPAAAKESDQRAQVAASKIKDEGEAAERERLIADARMRMVV